MEAKPMKESMATDATAAGDRLQLTEAMRRLATGKRIRTLPVTPDMLL